MTIRWGIVVVCSLLMGAAGTACWALWLFGLPPWPSWSEILQLNNQGVGYMEQYNYPQAEQAFRQVIQKSRGWVPGRINLAIALLNQNTPATLAESSSILRDILRKNPRDPHAHYCLAIILNQSGDPKAADHFEAVTRIDPADADAWYYLGQCRSAEDPQKATGCFRQAVQLNPYLSAAVYGLARQEIAAGNRETAQALFKQHQRLTDSKWETQAKIEYGRMGHYAEVIGRDLKLSGARTGPVPLFQPVEKLQVDLAEGTRWATADDFAGDPIKELRGRVRRRFGVTSATLDYNGDGKTDVLLLGAVVRDGDLGDLLLRNEGNWRFTDVTAEAGLAGARASLGCAVGDVDNDGWPDLFITCAGTNQLLRNTGGKFDDVTERAGILGQPMISLAAAFIDLDQDGDLDLYVTNYASVDYASIALTDQIPPPVPNSVFRNDSKARAVAADEAEQAGSAPLEIAFHAVTEPAELLAGEHSVGLAMGDFDNDRDMDLCLVQDGVPAVLILNDRLMQFHRQKISEVVLPAGTYNGAVAADFNKDGRLDLWVIAPEGPCYLLVNQGKSDDGILFSTGITNAESIEQARLVDLDLDGWFDIAGLARGSPALAHNESDRLALIPGAFGIGDARAMKPAATPSAGAATSAPAVAAVISDLDGDGPTDLLILTDAGLEARRNLGNPHHWLKLRLTGKRDAGKEMRTNRDAVAARFTVHAGDLWVEAEQGSQTAGLSAVYEPMLIGLGRHGTLDVVRVRWPDGTIQAELERAADQLLTLGEEQRKVISCPLLFSWNGSRFEYIADFLGGGGLGYLLAPGVYNVPDRDEAVKIEPGKLAPRDGRYILKIAEPMDEVTYLDRATLVAIDHSSDLSVYPNERFASPESRPDWKLYAFREPIFPGRATDEHGHDVTDKLRRWDRDAVDDFKLLGAWIGYAEEHSIVLDFADRLAHLSPTDPLILYLAGWVDYPFSETNYAAATAGVTLEPPTIERLSAEGEWQKVFPAAGHPAGSPKIMTLDVTGKLCGPSCVLRIRTNMQVYWDQIFAAPAEDQSALHVREMQLSDAQLGYRGHPQEYSPDRHGPTVHDYHRLDAVPMVRQSGRLTRYGDVRELLVDDDDRFVIFGAGDELTLEFDATALPELAPGSQRSFVLRSWGYCKSADVLTAHGDTIEPLPFRAMSGYPFGPDEKPPAPADQKAYQQAFNTRVNDR